MAPGVSYLLIVITLVQTVADLIITSIEQSLENGIFKITMQVITLTVIFQSFVK